MVDFELTASNFSLKFLDRDSDTIARLKLSHLERTLWQEKLTELL